MADSNDVNEVPASESMMDVDSSELSDEIITKDSVIKKTTSAYHFFNKENVKRVREELSMDISNITMGDVGKRMSELWRSLPVEERAVYNKMASDDKERFERQSRIKDAIIEEAQRKKREALTADVGGDTSKRAGRQKQDAIFAQRETERHARELKRSSRPLTEEEIQQKEEVKRRRKEKAASEKKVRDAHKKNEKEEKKDQKKRLEYLISQSDIFRKLKMGTGSADDIPSTSETPSSPSKRNARTFSQPEEEAEKDEDEEDEVETVFLRKQPDCIKFGQLKDYQLEGLNWMIHLRSKGLNGILADEMGLGKTLQSISILAYQFEALNINGPHLVVVPKSTLSNWMNEFARWCPVLRVLKFHGTKEWREENVQKYLTNAAASDTCYRPSSTDPVTGEDDHSKSTRKFDVIVTTYEVINSEKSALRKFPWQYLVIDEAHRLKNEASVFATTVREFKTRNRLLLTGTPLQNNLHELWALLNFLLPDIFSSAEQFDEWFDLDVDDDDAKKSMISTLHKILRPFMLRRLKSEVAKGLPPKTETLLMVGMSSVQKELYKKLLLRDIDSLTTSHKGGEGQRTQVLNILMQLRKACGHPYLFEGVEDRTLDPMGDHVITNCGKFVLLDKLLKKLKERGNRVLIFTQMTRILDILEDYMHIRGYEYCRIDGSTNYDNREAAIDAYNAPNSTKFCFLLSTRAGGLGINLQTADTVVLYDSDWNPQADLQAQDRAHRIGQKNPVSIYRLVTENTVEEKIVERAQQKLKLDAMVVQSGRLKEKDKVSKDEIMAAIKFGADKVFRSTESDITDDDIDAILARGEEKTKELTDKITKAEKGDMLNFSFDSGLSVQTYEGVDYSDSAFRDQLILLNADSMGKRERKQAAAPLTYTPDALVKAKKVMTFSEYTIRLPRSFRLPRMENFMFFDQKRLMQISQWEFEALHMLRMRERKLTTEQQHMTTILPAKIAEEKKKLLDAGFPMFNKRDYFRFARGVSNKGKDNLEAIASEMGMGVDLVEDYAKAFWEVGESHLGEKEWARVMKQIEKGQESVKTRATLSKMLTTYLGMFKDPRNEMTFNSRNEKPFVLDSDKSMLIATNKHGYGEWDKIKKDTILDRGLAFNHQVQGISDKDLSKRIDLRLRMLEREIASKSSADETKAKTLKQAIGHLAIENELEMKEKNRRFAPIVNAELKKGVEDTTEYRRKNRELWKESLLLVEDAAETVTQQTNEARDAILRGVGNVAVNYSLKSGLDTTKAADFGIGLGSSDFAEIRTNPLGSIEDSTMSGKSGKRAPKRKKVAITDADQALLVKAIGILGTNERTQVCEDFVKQHPLYHVKDVNQLFGILTVRKKYPFLPSHVKPNNSRAKCWFYLRAHFYDLVGEEEQKQFPGWEAVKAEDDKRWEEEVKLKQEKKVKNREKERAKKRAKKEAANGGNGGTGGAAAVAMDVTR